MSSRLLRCLRTPGAELCHPAGDGGRVGLAARPSWAHGDRGRVWELPRPWESPPESSAPECRLPRQAVWKSSFFIIFKKAAESHLLLARPPAAATENKCGGRSGDKTRGGNPAGLGRPLRLEVWGHPNLVAGACGSQRRLLCSLLPSPPPCLSLPMQTEAPCTSLPSWSWFS